MNTLILQKRTIVINPLGESDLVQIYDELKIAIKKTYTENELKSLLLAVIVESGKETIDSKKDAVKVLGNLARNVCDFSVDKFEYYRTHGVKASINSDINKLFIYTEKGLKTLDYYRVTAPAKVRALHKEIPKNKDELVDKLVSGLMAILIFYASAGGVDLEGGIPDLDLAAGVGYHRHWMSHSIVSGVIFEFTSRVIFNSYSHIHSNLPDSHHRFWDKSKTFIDKNKNLAIGAMWAGIGAHLIKDSALITGGFKPYVGMPLEMTENVHQGLFMANGLASSVFGASSMAKDMSVQVRETPIIYIEPSPINLKVMFRNYDTKAIKVLLEEIGESRYNECLDWALVKAKVKNRPKSMKGFYLEAIDNKVLLCFEYPSKTTVRIMDVKGYSNLPKTEWEFTKTNEISPNTN